jgi:osmoprotectant transport system permease protein
VRRGLDGTRDPRTLIHPVSDPRAIAATYDPRVLSMLLLGEDIGHKWLYWPWVGDHLDEIRSRLSEHVTLTLLAVGFGLLIALPLALLSSRYRRAYGPTLAVTGILYTIPSLALFALLLPITGLSRATAVIPLTGYTLLILIRNIVTGLDAVPDEVKEAADGMGYSRARRLFQVELPLALPAIVTGVRIAMVTTIGLVTVTALIGQGGLGALLLDGFQRDFRTPLTVGIVLSLALAVLADLLLLGALRLATPWRRAAGRHVATTQTVEPDQALAPSQVLV